jgi:hypothetical protein
MAGVAVEERDIDLVGIRLLLQRVAWDRISGRLRLERHRLDPVSAEQGVAVGVRHRSSAGGVHQRVPTKNGSSLPSAVRR